MSTYRVTFTDDGRIGRTRGNAPVDLTADDYDGLADAVYRHVRPKLASQGVEVVLGERLNGRLEGAVYCGFHVGARFTFEEVPA